MLKSPQLFENRSRSQPHKIRRHSIICTCVLEDGKTFQKCNVSSITIVCKQIKNFGYMQEATRLSWSGDQKMAFTTVVCSLYFSIVVEIVDSIQKVGQQMLQVRFFIVSRWMQTVDFDSIRRALCLFYLVIISTKCKFPIVIGPLQPTNLNPPMQYCYNIRQ